MRTQSAIKGATALALAAFGCGAGHAPRHAARQASVPQEPCSESWAEVAGPEVVQEFWTYSVDKSPEFVAWLLAIAWQESHFHPEVKSSAGAVGLLQLTSAGALEAAYFCGLTPLTRPGELNELLNRQRSIVYGSCLLKKYLSESEGNWASALMLYNGGYKQLTNYLGQRRLVPETEGYVRDVFYMRYACGPLGRERGAE